MVLSVMVEAWGDYALFTRPEMKVERVSYDVPTPSAVRGLMESIYWHPGMRYIVDRIWVLNPIQFTNVRRNEVKSKGSGSNAKAAMFGSDKELFIDRKADIQQRASLMLRNVHYVFETHFVLTENAADSDNPGKFQDIIKRRLEKGQHYSQPYFGCRECTAFVKLWDSGEIHAIPESRDLGWMLYDMDYTDSKDIQPQFFRPQMVNGLIEIHGKETNY